MVPLEFAGAETFDTLVSRKGERLIKSLCAIFLDRELAADAAQEAFVQLYLHWDEVIGKGDPEPWLYKVAINRGKDYRRGLARAARLFQRLVDTSGSEASAEDCSSQTEFMSVLSGSACPSTGSSRPLLQRGLLGCGNSHGHGHLRGFREYPSSSGSNGPRRDSGE